MSDDSFVILLYHGVDSGEAFSGNAAPRRREYILSQQLFEAHMGYLHQQGWRALLLEESLDHLAAGQTLQNVVVLTFDDGEASCYRTIAPILERFHFRGDFFIVSRFIGKAGYLTAGEIQELSNRGHGIHSHSASHPFLTKLDPQTIDEELRGSKDDIEAVTGKAVRFFSIPNGAYDRRVLEAARRVGYERVLSSAEGYNVAATRSFLLKRFAMRAYTHTKSLIAICEDRTATSCKLVVKRTVTLILKSLLTFRFYDRLRGRVVAAKIAKRP